jgi:hypothetical protein
MTIQDTYLKSRTQRAITLQEQSAFIVDHRREFPLPSHKSLVDLHYSRSTDEYGRFFDFENEWGKFSFDNETRSILVLRKGSPPDELLPQPKLALATATLHTGYASIHNNGSSFEMDFPTRQQMDYQALRLLNETLKVENIPVVIWSLDEAEGETPPIIRITNESAMLFASSAIWDNDAQQLVAAQVVTTGPELLKAIKATLANNNSKNFLTVKSPDGDAFLKGAKRGYVAMGNNLAGANAEGTVTTLLHPLTGDPQANSAEYFYIVVAPGENAPHKFAERLDLAIPWPIQAEWADYLLEAGQTHDLVYVLPDSGKDFTVGFKVLKNENLWQQIISDGLSSGHISIS